MGSDGLAMATQQVSVGNVGLLLPDSRLLCAKLGRPEGIMTVSQRAVWSELSLPPRPPPSPLRAPVPQQEMGCSHPTACSCAW